MAMEEYEIDAEPIVVKANAAKIVPPFLRLARTRRAGMS
jgi:hypothetical protein